MTPNSRPFVIEMYAAIDGGRYPIKRATGEDYGRGGYFSWPDTTPFPRFEMAQSRVGKMARTPMLPIPTPMIAPRDVHGFRKCAA